MRREDRFGSFSDVAGAMSALPLEADNGGFARAQSRSRRESPPLQRCLRHAGLCQNQTSTQTFDASSMDHRPA